MPQLNYMAIMCDDPENQRDWYQRWFGFDEINRAVGGGAYLSDGYFTLALLKRGAAVGESDDKRGLHHFGFQVESVTEIERTLEDVDPSIRIERRPSEDPYAEYRLRDPEGVIVDLSEKGYGSAGEHRVPSIRHLALFNRDPERKFAFYRGVFGMRDATRSQAEIEQQFTVSMGRAPRDERPTTSPFCGDGAVNVAMLGRNMTEEQGASKWGFNHFGILVRDPLDLVREMGQMDSSDHPADTRPPERQVEYGVRDPEGNRLDLSGKKGWKVDEERWARIGD